MFEDFFNAPGLAIISGFLPVEISSPLACCLYILYLLVYGCNALSGSLVIGAKHSGATLSTVITADQDEI